MAELVLPPEENLGEFGRAIGRARNAAKLTFEQLAERADVSRRTLINIEHGKANPTVKKVHAIAHALNVPIADLVNALCVDHKPSG
jgi:transcriptional regulator with XRE-family HTH domain